MLKNIGSNWAVAMLQILVLVQLTPVQVKALGEDANGVWLTIASLTSALGLLILGVPMASVRFIAQHVAQKDLEGENKTIGVCITMCLGLGACAVGLGAALSFFFEHTYLASPAWRALGDGIRREARIAYWLTVVQLSVGFVAQIPFGILEAHHEFVPRNAVKVLCLLLRLALVIFVLRVYPSLVLLALIQAMLLGVEFATAMLVIGRRCPGVRFRPQLGDRAAVGRILSFSLFAMLLGVGSQLAFRSDVLVIGAFLEPSEGTFFDVGNKFFPPLVEVVLGVGMVVMPTAAKLGATNAQSELGPLLLKWSKISFSIALLVGAYLVVLGPEFVGWWMGHTFALRSGAVVRILMISFLAFLPVRGVALPLLAGLGKPQQPAIALLIMGAVNLGLSLLLVKPYGIVGVAMGTAIPNVFFAAYVAVIACLEAGVRVRDYVRYVSRPLLAFAPSVALLVFLKDGVHLFSVAGSRLQLFGALVAAGVLMVVTFAALSIALVFRDDPYTEISAPLTRLVPLLRSRRSP